MPFGSFFAASVFIVLGSISVLRAATGPGGIGALFEPFRAVFFTGLAVGLLARRRWARWTGFLALGLLAGLAAPAVGTRGEARDLLRFLVPSVSLLLLAVPATGDPGKGLGGGVRPLPRAGRMAGWATIVAGLPLVVSAGLTSWRALPIPIAPRVTAPTVARVSASRVEWLDFGPALERARASGKPLFVDFYATWCGPCQGMERMTFRDPRVVKTLSGLVSSRVNSEETIERAGLRGADLAARFRVGSYPTLVLLDPSGREISRRTGFVEASDLVDWLEREARGAEPGGPS